MGSKQLVQYAGNGKNNVEILHWQQILLSGFKPTGLVEALAFGTVAIETGVVEGCPVTAMITLLHMAAEDRGTTIENILHHL